MTRYGWIYTWSTKFNNNDSLLMVSGVCTEVDGEIAIFKCQGMYFFPSL